MAWLDLLAVQGTLKGLLQHHSSEASILRRSAFFMVQPSHPYMTAGKPLLQSQLGKVVAGPHASLTVRRTGLDSDRFGV